MTNGGYSPEEFVLDSTGKPIRDRYGRPVRKRTSDSAAVPTHQDSAGAGAPKQYFPPQEQRQASAQRPGSHQSTSSPRQQPPPQQYSRGSSQRAPHQSRQRAAAHSAPRQYIPPAQPQHRPAPRPAYQGPPRQTAPRRRRGGCLRILGWFLVITIVLTGALMLWLDSKLDRVDTSPATTIANTSGTNWLLVGSDSRDGYTDEDAARLGTGGDLGSMRTDTIMVLHIPRGTGKPTLMSLPRDSYVSIPGFGQDKINAAYAYGGPPLLVETVEQATGLHMDRYAEIGMNGLANVVDAIGGIEVCPEEDIDDPLANLNITAGCQKIDGLTALGYVRTRATANGDLDRVARQREFLSSLTNSATSIGTIMNPIKVLRLFNTVPASITVGEGDHIWNLARIAFAMGSGLETTTVPVGGFASYDVGDVVLWDEAAAAELFDSLR